MGALAVTLIWIGSVLGYLLMMSVAAGLVMRFIIFDDRDRADGRAIWENMDGDDICMVVLIGLTWPIFTAVSLLAGAVYGPIRLVGGLIGLSPQERRVRALGRRR